MDELGGVFFTLHIKGSNVRVINGETLRKLIPNFVPDSFTSCHSALSTLGLDEKQQEVLEQRGHITLERDGIILHLSEIALPGTDSVIISGYALKNTETEHTLDIIPMGYLEIDGEDHTILHSNDKMAELLDMPTSYLIGSTLNEWLTEEYHRDLEAGLDAISKGGSPSFEVELRGRRGTRPVEIHLFSNSGRVGCIIRDISDIKQMEQSLRESELFKTTIIESIQDGITMLSLDGRITYLNMRFGTLFQRAAGELLGQKFSDLLENDSPQLINDIRSLERGVSEFITSIGGKDRRISVSWNRILSPDGEPEAILLLSRDVTLIHGMRNN